MFVVLSNAQIGIGTTTPNSTLDVRGSISTSYRAFTANTTATATDNLLVFTGTSAATLTLPTAVGCEGRTYMIKNASTTGPLPVLTIATTSSQTIDGVATKTLTLAYETVTVISNGSGWNISATGLPNGSGSSATDWAQDGNAVAAQKSLGTTSNYSLPFITNNVERMRLSNVGNLGIGTSTFNATNPEKLVVDAGITASVNAIVGKGSIDNYLQLNIQNNSAGTNASSDVVATANNGSETTNYVDMGINGGGNTSGVMGSANDAYLYNIGQNLLVGTGSASKSLVFMTGGTTQSTNERARFDGSGNFGIGTTSPSYKLHVNASSNPLYLGGVQSGTNTDSVVTIQNGVIKKIHPSLLPGGNNWLITGNSGINPATNFLGTTDDKQMILKSNGQSYLEFGRRQTLGLTQGYTDYDNNDEKVTYVRSALQFEAPGADFYKPKMFTDANGNFRVKGSSASTDYFEFGSTGSSNNGGFEFIIGDDGDEPILFKSYNYLTGMSEIMRLQSGRMAVGSNAFNATNPEKLLIDAGVTTSYNLMTGKGSIDNYLQINVQNRSNGTSASSDLVATADNGTETSNYIDMGVNSSGYNNSLVPVLNGINNTYLYGAGNDFTIGNLGNNKPLIFFTTPNATQSNAAERMRIDGSGNVGIGTTNPLYKLHVNASSNPLYLAGVQTGAGTDSLVTILNGVVRKIHTSALSSSNAWGLTGNAGTTAGTNFIGTTDAQALVIKQNNTQVGRFNTNSLSLGISSTTNTATNSYAIGTSSSIAFGKTNAFAIGNSASTTETNSFAIGNSAVTNGANSFAIGNGATANNTNSVAIGSAATTAFSITDALAVGSGATANSTNAIAIGKSATVGFSLTSAIAIGNAVNVDASNGVAIGNSASLGSLSNATVLGANSSASGTANNSTAIGYNADVTIANTVLLGDKSNSGLSVAIGSENFSASREKLLVDAGTTTSYNVISGKGSIDNYLQLNIQNTSAGTSASSDVVATANNGNETTNYIDMGINGGNYSGGVMGAANDGYLYNIGQNLLIGTGTAAKSVVFMTGGTSQGTNERARIDGTGNFGIGTTSPTQKLDVSGNMRLSGAFMPGNTAGTTGYFLQSNGAGVAPTWIDPGTYLNSLTWAQGGNSVASIQKLGTTSNYDLPIITNNTERMRITSNGDVAIGTSTFSSTNAEQLLVNAGTPATITDYQNVIVGKGNTNSYAQLNIQNTYSAANNSASSDVVATSDNGNESTNFIDMGINSGTNTTTGILGGGNTAYLYSTGNNFAIGNATASKDIMIFTGGTGASNERMRINGSGNVGIGNTNPTSTLSVAGSTAHSIVTKTANYTATASDYSILVNNSGAATITLPVASTAAGRVYNIKKISGVLNNVVIDPNGSETIDGALTRTLTMQYEAVIIQCDGTSWYILSKFL